MSDKTGVIQASSGGGVSGEHPPADAFQFIAGPTTDDQFNTAHLRLIPISCWRVDDVRFAFDSSFVDSDPSATDNPNDIRAELAHLLTLVKAHPGAPLSIFGHADPVGNDDYNKSLSGRRANAIYALILAQGDPDSAVKLWQAISATENWGSPQRQKMQDLTGLDRSSSQSTLIRAYLQKLCPTGLSLKKSDFLARGADAGGKGDVQGCSEFNPVLIFSQEKQAEFEQAKQNNDAVGIADRNEQNAPNRRVMVLMFRKGSRVDPAKWPCPRTSEGVAGCRKRFWSDGETRRSTHLPGVDRQFEVSHDTFACRFYQRLGSTCDHRRRLFRYCLEEIAKIPWPDDAILRVFSDNGSQTFQFKVGDGRLVATGREFLLAGIEEGVQYRGEVTADKLVLGVFGFTDLFRVQDPADPLNILSFPQQPPEQQEQDPDTVADGPDPTGTDDVDVDAVDNAITLQPGRTIRV